MSASTGEGSPPPDILTSNQLFQARLKAHDVLQEHLKQIITVASATLALTITFLKDIVGSAGASVTFQVLLPISWILLSFSICGAIWAIATLVNNLDAPNQQYPDKSFAAGGRADIQPVILVTSILFGLGMLSLGIFAASNYDLFLRRQDQEHKIQSATQAVNTVKKQLPANTYSRLDKVELIRGLDEASSKSSVWLVQFENRKRVSKNNKTWLTVSTLTYFVNPVTGNVTKVS